MNPAHWFSTWIASIASVASIGSVALAVLATALPIRVDAYDGPVEKKAFEMPSYTTVGGKTIRQVKVGYETYGKLNATADNVVFIAHFFSGNSHAAGRYKPGDAAPGYWDSIIGAGRPIDTDRFFVVAADTLANLNTKDPNTVTTGPASIDPATGKPYAMSFPVVTIRDFVNVHKALLDSLGVKRLYAVAGASMGAIQAVEWTAAYPDFVPRAITVIPGGLEADPYLIAMTNRWAAPILLDPSWNGGDYYGKAEPTRGLAEALKQVTLDARHYGWAEKTFGRKWAAADRNPLDALANKYAIEEGLDKAAAGRAAVSDANSFLYLVRANQLFQMGQSGDVQKALAGVKARFLVIPASSDLLLFPDYARRMTRQLREAGREVEYFEIEGDGGHLDGVLNVSKASQQIAWFLAK